MSSNREIHKIRKAQNYSNKYKVEQWEKRRRKAALKKCCKEFQNTADCPFDREKFLISKCTDINKERPARESAYQRAEKDYKQRQMQRLAKSEGAEKKRAEKSQARTKYQANKTEVFIKLAKRTKTRQPVMKERIELLHRKLQMSFQSQC